MKKTLLAAFIISLANPSWAATNQCPASPNKDLPKDTVVVFYETVKKNQTIYVPILNITKTAINPARETLIPKEMTLYDLRTNKPLKVTFKNFHDDVDYDLCRSIGIGKEKNKGNLPALFASQPIADQFNFKPSDEDVSRFSKTLSSPCKPGEKTEDNTGVMLCDTDQLIAVSHFLGKTQYWRTKQYRYDVGFAINDVTDMKMEQIAEDCARCKD